MTKRNSKKTDAENFWMNHNKFIKKIKNHIPESETEKAIIIMNAFFWSVYHHETMPVCQNVKTKDVEKVWVCLQDLKKGSQMAWLKDGAGFRILLKKNGKTVDEVDVFQ